MMIIIIIIIIEYSIHSNNFKAKKKRIKYLPMSPYFDFTYYYFTDYVYSVGNLFLFLFFVSVENRSNRLSKH